MRSKGAVLDPGTSHPPTSNKPHAAHQEEDDDVIPTATIRGGDSEDFAVVEMRPTVKVGFQNPKSQTKEFTLTQSMGRWVES